MNWITRLSASRFNYYAGFVLDCVVATALIVVGRAHPLPLVLGVLSYTLLEYFFHRWIYHRLGNVIGRIHDVHHRDRSARFGAPFFYSMGITAICAFVAGPVFAGAVLGSYACQSAIHHVAHGWTGTYKLRGPIARRWRRHHLLHHRDITVNLGILTSLWDRVFGTYVTRAAQLSAPRPTPESPVPAPTLPVASREAR